MRKFTRLYEVTAGLIILLAISIFVVLFARKVVASNSSTYPVIAIFQDVGGLTPSSAVTIKGVNVGKISSIKMLPDYSIRVVLDISTDVAIPNNSVASVNTATLFSDKRVEIIPGNSKIYLRPNETITHTKDFIYLEDKISKAIFK